ncbi:VOC family protein [Pseudoalteromonas luteoviolacea]|uniref:VOC family protein n=1 Tax=Pseudoalteromonas luteoviolacea TaxID=43657 RepID=UPI001F379B26|nr:VOC family protein [Pseudoalteromonas luteoviolacea]MCF6442207.1 VOC family protein [Pseudoalteromonas luteoviolacea]
MALIERSQVGEFCWSELCSADWAAGKSFYTQLFDWQSVDQPIGEDCYYTMLQKHGVDIAAMYEMMPEQKAAKIPSHWLGYIAVNNVDELAERATALGAEIIAGPHDVPEAGRMVMLHEPGGAHFALWQAGAHTGTQRELEANVPYWYELASQNSAKSEAFYCNLLGWQADHQAMENMDYVVFSHQGKPVAGMLEMTEEWQGLPPHWMLYFAVLDCDKFAEKATSLGGEVCVPPTDIPQVGRFAVITDPQGAVFSIMTSAMDEITS